MKFNPTSHRTTHAFALLELMVACGLLAIVSAAAIGGLIQMNNNAALSRLQTSASTIAQARIDRILQDGPFDLSKNKIPAVLQPGTQTIGSESAPSIPIYTDPENNAVVVNGWMTSTVTDVQSDYGPSTIHVYQAAVTVSYKFRGRLHSVSMQTVRSPEA